MMIPPCNIYDEERYMESFLLQNDIHIMYLFLICLIICGWYLCYGNPGFIYCYAVCSVSFPSLNYSPLLVPACSIHDGSL